VGVTRNQADHSHVNKEKQKADETGRKWLLRGVLQLTSSLILQSLGSYVSATDSPAG
jgi:hypothetical protein